MTKDWYTWTIGEIEDNLNLLQAQAVDYLREPFECDCFLKHTSIIRGYANEMQSFAKTDEEKELLSRLAAWSDKWHKIFEGKKLVPKEVMQSLHDETRDMRKGVEDQFFIKKGGENPALDNPREHKHTLSCKHGKCECVIRGHPKEHFAKESFRRLKDQPKPGYDMIVGCPKGQFRAGKCQVGTELHKIIAPMDKCKKDKPGNPIEAKTPAEHFLVEMFGSMEQAEKEYGIVWGVESDKLLFYPEKLTVGQVSKIKKAGGKYGPDNFWRVKFPEVEY